MDNNEQKVEWPSEEWLEGILKEKPPPEVPLLPPKKKPETIREIVEKRKKKQLEASEE